MGQPGRKQRVTRADVSRNHRADVVELDRWRRRRELERRKPIKLYPEHFLIGAIVLSAYVIAAMAVL